jgi:hypothetical protein
MRAERSLNFELLFHSGEKVQSNDDFYARKCFDKFKVLDSNEI